MLSVLSFLMFLIDSAYGLYVTFSCCVTQRDLAACIWKAGESKCSSLCAQRVHIVISHLYGCCCSIQWSIQGRTSVLASAKLPLLTLWSTAWRYLTVIRETYYVGFCEWSTTWFSLQRVCALSCSWGAGDFRSIVFINQQQSNSDLCDGALFMRSRSLVCVFECDSNLFLEKVHIRAEKTQEWRFN